MQFPPDVDKSEPIKAFVNDLSRNCFFDYSYTSDQYPHLETYMYTIQRALMLNSTENPLNENF
jgi:hypothetical protein